MFPRSVIEDFRAHAVAEFPKEACGLVVDFGETGCKYVPCENIAESPNIDFEIDPTIYVTHMQDGREVKAVMHSHVLGPAHPSFLDKKNQIATALPWGIGVVKNAKEPFCEEPFFFGDECPTLPLIGRPFRYAVHDCFELVRDYYREKGIVNIPAFASEWEWWLNGENHYLEMFPKSGFVEIDPKDAKEHDAILIRFRPSPVPQHAAIYLGDETILHHKQDALSNREAVHRWMPMATHWLRYEGVK